MGLIAAIRGWKLRVRGLPHRFLQGLVLYYMSVLEKKNICKFLFKLAFYVMILYCFCFNVRLLVKRGNLDENRLCRRLLPILVKFLVFTLMFNSCMVI